MHHAYTDAQKGLAQHSAKMNIVTTCYLQRNEEWIHSNIHRLAGGLFRHSNCGRSIVQFSRLRS